MPRAAYSNTLDETVINTLPTNPKVLQKINQYNESIEIHNQEKADYLPTIDVSTHLRSDDTKSKNYHSKMNKNDLSVNLHQNIFNGFYTTYQSESLNYQTQASKWSVISIAEDTALNISKVYIHYIEATKLVTLAQNNVDKHNNIYQRIKEKTESGLGSIADLSQIEGRRARAYSNFIAAQNNLADATAEYISVTNEQPYNLQMPKINTHLMPTSLNMAIKLAQKNHPAINSSKSKIKAIHADKKSSYANFYPNISIELGHNWSDQNYRKSNYKDGSQQEFYAEVELRYNLFNGGKDIYKNKQLAYKLEQEKDSEVDIYHDVIQSTTLSWNAYKYIGQKLGYIHNHVQSAEETQINYEQQFKLGQRSLVDLLDSENELFEAKKDYIHSKNEQILAYYRILNATGMLLQSFKINALV